MGALKNQLKSDLVVAMKARDEQARTTIRMAIAAIMNAEVSGPAHELSDEEELRILTREVRTREDSARTYADAGRAELAEKESAEAALLSRYLPARLSEDEVTAMVAEEIRAVCGDEAPTMRSMSAIVRAVNARAAGRAEGRAVAAAVKRAITG